MAKRTARNIQATRGVIRSIRSAALRTAFASLADGADYGLSHRDPKLALRCIGHLITLTRSLNDTITPRVGARMMRALSSDAARLGLRLGPTGFKEKEDKACSVGPYDYVCSHSPGSTCMEDSTGCASWPKD